MIKRVYFLLSMLFVFCETALQAQCTSCTPAFIPTCPTTGGLCSRLDTAYASLPYSKVINFYMPAVLTDPSILSQCDGCSQVDLNQITVTGVGGLPAGINYSLSNGGTYNVQGGDTIGCATFCGTPLVPGVYPVTVYLSANVVAIGTPIGNVSRNNVPQQYVDTLWVLPDTVPGVTSFTYGNNGFVACDSITVNLSAKLTAPQPNLTRWFWQIGNQTSQLQSPGSFTFTNNGSVPDTIPITLSTVFYNYTVSSAHITNITGGFCGLLDNPYCYIECACISCADKPNPYVSFPDLGYTSASLSCVCTNANYTNINQSIPLGTFVTPIQTWAAANSLLCQAVLLGTDSLHVGLGQQNWADNNTDGFVQFDTVAGTTVTETLYVIVNPNPTQPVVAPAQDTFCSNDSVLLTIDSAAGYVHSTFQWYLDTVFLTGVTDSAFYAYQAGNYKVIVTNQATGCSSTSPFKTVTVAATPSPSTVVYSGSNEYLNPAPGSGFAVNWYYNGNLVAGQSGHTLPYYGAGTYAAQIYNVSDPGCTVTATTDTVAGIGSVKPVVNVSIYPNPNDGTFTLGFHSEQVQNLDIRLQNDLGQTVYNNNISHFSGDFNQQVETRGLSKGIYLLTIESEQGIYSGKLIVQ
jgi:Secretion system C-terminal sorting domain